MAEVANELIYKVLKSMQARMGRMEGALSENRGELTAVRGNIYAVHQAIGKIYATLGCNDTRLERIERRSELGEAEPA